MTDKKSSTPEQEKEKSEKPVKAKRKKATVGAWWKSTTIDVISSVDETSESETLNSLQPAKTKSPARQGNKSGEAPAAILPEKQAGKRPPSGAKASTEENKQQNSGSDPAQHGSTGWDTGDIIGEPSPSGQEKIEGGAPKQDKPRRKRGRPRKKPDEKKEDAVSKEEVVQTPAQVSAPSQAPEEIKSPKRKRSPRKKKPAQPAAGTTERETFSSNEQDTFSDNGEELPGKHQRDTAAKHIDTEEATAEAASGPDTEFLQGAAGEADLVTGEEGSEQDADVSTKKSTPGATAQKKEVSGKQQEQQNRKQPAPQKNAEPEHKPVIKLLINAEEPEECRLALLEDGVLESIHVATSTRTQTKNNIYKAKIVAIEPNLQAAFVEYGTEKNGFLPFSEIHPEYYKENVSEKVQHYIDQQQWKKLSITDVVERGREVLVQVVKEEVGKKGANMTTYLSLPGRCVVLMPGSDSRGISRKISGEERRSLLREYLLSMDIPEGIGWIVRTASVDITKTALARDVNYLLNLWEEVKKKGQELEGVGLIYQDHDHVLRFLREHFDPDIQEILVDDKDALEQVKGFIELLPSKQRNVRCKLHKGSRPIFNQYSIEDQIESIYQPKVNLPSGGSIVIDPTEALVAIDVNSGSTGKGKNFEDTIFQANMEAAKELARQLRLRDLGGLIVVDFIDMRSQKNIREVEKQVKTAMKRDKAKVDISRISKFGLMQISRQKLGAPIEAGNYRVCSYCNGRGVVRSVETLALFYLRRIHTAASRKMVMQIECRFPLDVAQYLLNNKRTELGELEQKYDTEVIIIADPSFKPADNEIVFHKREKEETAKKQP
ncbi:MAG: Rne/Rng family ribonuclease [Desulfopila sp.]|jgi:ribonuclease E|nr:Rne/Rng family ribonuclease [Desulfopila sp.]